MISKHLDYLAKQKCLSILIYCVYIQLAEWAELQVKQMMFGHLNIIQPLVPNYCSVSSDVTKKKGIQSTES